MSPAGAPCSSSCPPANDFRSELNTYFILREGVIRILINAVDFIQALSLKEFTHSTRKQWDLHSADLNRPGMQFVGFYEYFAYERPQVVGLVEMSYLKSLPEDVLRTRLEAYFAYPIPCVVVCRGMAPPDIMLELAEKHNVSVLGTDTETTRFSVSAITYLSTCLAPRSRMHGVLLDVYGVGVLITGSSIMGDLKDGSVTCGELNALFEDSQNMVLCKMTGGELRKLLEESFSSYPDVGGCFQVAGLSLVYSRDTGFGSALSEITVGNHNLDDARTYTVAMTNDMLKMDESEETAWDVVAYYKCMGTIMNAYVSRMSGFTLEMSADTDIEDIENADNSTQRIVID